MEGRVRAASPTVAAVVNTVYVYAGIDTGRPMLQLGVALPIKLRSSSPGDLFPAQKNFVFINLAQVTCFQLNKTSFY